MAAAMTDDADTRNSAAEAVASLPPLSAGPGEAPWVEKYRPKVVRGRISLLEDVTGNEPVIERLRSIAEQGNMNNLILAGPPGTGKTTSVHCLARTLLGAAYKDAVLELNASDDRGIDVVRDNIKNFARRKVTLPAGRHKIVILDEADSMTPSAQQALRRTMEIYSNSTRFALACNNSTKIIEPIQSRCAVLRFARLSDEQILRRLLEVCEAESVPYEEKGLEAILFTSEGDMRHALNNLQSTFAGFNLVNEENVFKVCDQPHPMTVRAILDGCVSADVERALSSLHSLWTEGYSSLDIVGTIFRVARGYDMQEALLLEYLREIGMVHMRVADGVASLLQLQGLVSRLCRLSMQSGVTPPSATEKE